MNFLMLGLLAITGVVTYVAWVRPLLKKVPSFRDFYVEEGNIFTALRLKFAGLKQKVTTAFIIAAGTAVTMYDYLAPYLYGVDFGHVTNKVPSWAWPIILMIITGLLGWFRKLSGDRESDSL